MRCLCIHKQRKLVRWLIQIDAESVAGLKSVFAAVLLQLDTSAKCSTFYAVSSPDKVTFESS